MSAAWQLKQLLRRAAGDQIAVLVGEANYAVRITYIDPLWIRSGWIEVDAERQVQPGGELRDLLRFAIRANAAKDLDLVGIAFCQKDVSVGRSANQPRVLEVGGVQLHLEAFGSHRPDSLRPGNHVRSVVDGFAGRRRRQVSRRHVASNAGRLVSIVGEGSLPGQGAVGRRLGVGRGSRAGGFCGETGRGEQRKRSETENCKAKGYRQRKLGAHATPWVERGMGCDMDRLDQVCSG